MLIVTIGMNSVERLFLYRSEVYTIVWTPYRFPIRLSWHFGCSYILFHLTFWNWCGTAWRKLILIFDLIVNSKGFLYNLCNFLSILILNFFNAAEKTNGLVGIIEHFELEVSTWFITYMIMIENSTVYTYADEKFDLLP